MISSHPVYQIKRKIVLTFTTLSAVLMVMNLLLVQQNRELKASTRRSDRPLEVHPGTKLPPLKGVAASGDKVVFGFDDPARKTVLLVLSPTCRPCQENMVNWKAMVKRLDKQSYRVIAVSLKPDQAKEYVESHQLDNIPVITEVDPETKAAYSLSATPQTILLDSNGEAEKVWSGILAGQKREEVEATFNIKLTGKF